MLDSAFINSGNLTFNGNMGTIDFSQCLFNCNASGTVFILPSTLTITRRFRVIYSSFIILSGETGINLNSSAVIPDDSFILTYCNFSGGSSTYLGGLDYTSNKSLFINNINITNTSNVGNIYLQNNNTDTPIGATGTFVKALGTTTLGTLNSPKWITDSSSNRIKYTGNETSFFSILASGSCSSHGANDTIGVCIAKNGSTITISRISVRAFTQHQPVSFTVQHADDVTTNDYYEVWITNETNTTSVKLTDLNIIIHKIT